MFPKYRPHIAQNISELKDYIGSMVLSSPTFLDKTGYFPDKNLETTFFGLNESLLQNRRLLGEELYLKLRVMSDEMRAHFEADPENETDDTLKGRAIIYQMEELLKQHTRRR